MMKRIIFDCILCLSIFLFPWWVAFGLGVIGLFFFTSFYEVVAVGLGLDSLYGVPTVRFHSYEFVMTLGALVAFAAIEIMKRQLRIYRSR